MQSAHFIGVVVSNMSMNRLGFPHNLKEWGHSLMNVFRKKEEETVLPVLCKFWQEDGVWNAVAEHLAVAVFGYSFEEAQRNLREAIVAHMECWVEEGKGDELVNLLLSRSHGQLQVEQLSPDAAVLKMEVGVHDHHVHAVTA